MAGLAAIVLDMDDTLYLERDYVFSGFGAVARWCARHWGIAEREGYEELCQAFEQGVRGDNFDRWLATRGLTDRERVEQLVEVYRAHRPSIAPFPEVSAMLRRLRARYRLALLSDGILSVQQAKLDALGLGDFFQAVVFSDRLGPGRGKPHPAPYLEVARQMGVEPGQAVYLADNPAKDFLGARRAGMWSIRLRVLGGIYGALEPASAEHAPDLEIAAWDQLENALAKLPPGQQRI